MTLELQIGIPVLIVFLIVVGWIARDFWWHRFRTHHSLKSWRTTLFGVFCWACCIWGILDNFRCNRTAFPYWQFPISMFACGYIGFHARDTKHKD